MIYPKYPTRYIAFTQYFSSKHQAIDIANAVTVDGILNDNKDVFMAHDGKIITNSYASDYGYFIEYEVFDGNDRYVFADGHFDKPSNLKVGETYPQGTFINRMGNSGTSAGMHDHHRITKNGVRLNPLECEYVYPDQIVGTREHAKLLFYNPEIRPVEPTKDNDFKIGDKVLVLNGRATASSDGSGSVTAEYDGNMNDAGNIKYITIINEGAIRPYHLSNEPENIHPRGWVSASQIKKI